MRVTSDIVSIQINSNFFLNKGGVKRQKNSRLDTDELKVELLCWSFLTLRLTTHQAEHEFQITTAVLHRVVHVTRRFTISPQVIVRAHSGGTFVGEITPSLFRVQVLRPRCIVYSISPHVYVPEASSHNYHIRSQRGASGFAHHYLYSKRRFNKHYPRTTLIESRNSS